MIRRNVLPNLDEAIAWLRDTWEARDTPDRLHTREHEGWGLAYAPAFARRLRARPDDAVLVTSTRTCNHLRIIRDASPWECPDCQGVGTYEAESFVYQWPMWRAMSKLYAENRTAHDVVLTLVINAYDVADTIEVAPTTTEELRLAIVALHVRYEVSPPGRRLDWLSKSDSQRAAESVA